MKKPFLIIFLAFFQPLLARDSEDGQESGGVEGHGFGLEPGLLLSSHFFSHLYKCCVVVYINALRRFFFFFWRGVCDKSSILID